MRVELDNGTRFITNFRYNIKPKLSQDPLADGASAFAGTKTGDYASFDSDCSKTMVGFVQQVHGNGSMKAHNVQCFYASQNVHSNVQSTSMVERNDGSKIAMIESTKSALVQKKTAAVVEESVTDEAEVQTADVPEEVLDLQLDSEIFAEVNARRSHKRQNVHHTHIPSDINDLLIETINDLDIGWKADTCKYQKHHEKYGAHCEKEQVGLA